jgi:hypothetical protein
MSEYSDLTCDNIAALHFCNIATQACRCEERVSHDEIEKPTGDPAQIPDGGPVKTTLATSRRFGIRNCRLEVRHAVFSEAVTRTAAL